MASPMRAFKRDFIWWKTLVETGLANYTASHDFTLRHYQNFRNNIILCDLKSRKLGLKIISNIYNVAFVTIKPCNFMQWRKFYFTSHNKLSKIGHTRTSFWLSYTAIQILVSFCNFLQSEGSSKSSVIDVLSLGYWYIFSISSLQTKINIWKTGS